MLDLEEELVALGYSNPYAGMTYAELVVQDGGKRHLTSFRVTGVRDPEKRRVRHRRYAAEARAALRRKRMNEAEAARLEREAFLATLEAEGLADDVRMICIGRAITDDANRPEPSRLARGKDPDELAARIDLATFLVHPLRAWSIARIAELFGESRGRIKKWLASRPGAAKRA